MTVSGELCCVALPFCCVVVVVVFLSISWSDCSYTCIYTCTQYVGVCFCIAQTLPSVYKCLCLHTFLEQNTQQNITIQCTVQYVHVFVGQYDFELKTLNVLYRGLQDACPGSVVDGWWQLLDTSVYLCKRRIVLYSDSPILWNVCVQLCAIYVYISICMGSQGGPPPPPTWFP